MHLYSTFELQHMSSLNSICFDVELAPVIEKHVIMSAVFEDELSTTENSQAIRKQPDK